MKTYETKIDIAAGAERVWSELTQKMPHDTASFGINRFEGTMAQGAKIKLWTDIAPDRAFAITVTTFDPPNRMVWTGGMPFGLFKGRRTFDILQDGTGVQFQMKEVFSGVLSGPITKSMPDLTQSFVQFANALKSKAERQ